MSWKPRRTPVSGQSTAVNLRREQEVLYRHSDVFPLNMVCNTDAFQRRLASGATVLRDGNIIQVRTHVPRRSTMLVTSSSRQVCSISRRGGRKT